MQFPKSLQRALRTITIFLGWAFVTSCTSTGGGGEASSSPGVGESSQPVNRKEEVQYKQSLIRCYKTGGTRIVKINGVLRCF